MCKELPPYVRCLLKTYDIDSLRWEVADDRYAIVREILDRGSEEAQGWLAAHLGDAEIRGLLKEYRGAGFDEPAREKLRTKFSLTTADMPIRPFIPWKGAILKRKV